MVNELNLQTIISEFDSQWVVYTTIFVLRVFDITVIVKGICLNERFQTLDKAVCVSLEKGTNLSLPPLTHQNRLSSLASVRQSVQTKEKSETKPV